MKNVKFLREINIYKDGKDTGKKGYYSVETGTMATISDITEVMGLKIQGLGDRVNIVTEAPKPLKGRKIVLSAGHGGKYVNQSPINSTYKEKDFVLKVCLQLEKDLKSLGAEVIQLRSKDVEYLIGDRAEAINKLTDVDLVLDVHTNATAPPYPSAANGVVVYHSRLNKTNNAKILAENVAKEMGLALRPTYVATRLNSSGTDYYGMIRETKYPTYIVEGGFHSNTNDIKVLTSKDAHIKYAKGLEKALLQIFR